MTIKVKVITKSSQNSVIKLVNDVYDYKVKTTVVAEHGKANLAVIELLAKYLQIKSRQLRIVAGHTSNLKIIEVDE